MLSNFFLGFDAPSIFDFEGIDKRRRKFDKHFNRRSNFLSNWADDFDLFPKPSPAEIKQAKLESLKRQEHDIQERQKAVQQYLEDLKKQETATHQAYDKLEKMEVPKEQPKKEKKSAIRKLFGSDDEIDKLFDYFTKPQKKTKDEKQSQQQEQDQPEEKKDQPAEEKKDQQMEEEKNNPPELSKEQSVARQEENASKLGELKQKLTDQGFKCKESDQNDDKDWIVGKKKFVNDQNQKEKQVFYQIHDKSNPNCNYSGYTKQVRDDDGSYSTVKKSVYHYENI